MVIKGGAARLLMMSCYFVAFCCSVIITGASAWIRPRNIGSLVLGLTSMLWSFTSFMLICCTAGISLFASGRIIIDILFMGVMISIAAVNRSGTDGCDASPYPGVVRYGSRMSGCRLFVAAFAVAIIGLFMYIITAAMQALIWRRGSEKDTRSSRV